MSDKSSYGQSGSGTLGEDEKSSKWQKLPFILVITVISEIIIFPTLYNLPVYKHVLTRVITVSF